MYFYKVKVEIQILFISQKKEPLLDLRSVFHFQHDLLFRVLGIICISVHLGGFILGLMLNNTFYLHDKQFRSVAPFSKQLTTLANGNIMQTTCEPHIYFKFFLQSHIKRQKNNVKLIAIIYLTWYSQNVIFQHIINMKLLIRYFTFFFAY